MNTLQTAIEDELVKIADADPDEDLAVAAILTAAADPASPLHEEFEWDDSIAGRLYREGQARQMVRNVRVLVTVNEIQISVPAYVRNADKSRKEQGYSSVYRVRTDREKAVRTVDAEITRVRGLVARARQVAIGLGLHAEFEAKLTEAISRS